MTNKKKFTGKQAIETLKNISSLLKRKSNLEMLASLEMAEYVGQENSELHKQELMRVEGQLHTVLFNLEHTLYSEF